MHLLITIFIILIEPKLNLRISCFQQAKKHPAGTINFIFIFGLIRQ